MPLIYRLVKGSPLTNGEVDGNFSYLDNNKQPANANLDVLAAAVWAANQLQYQTAAGAVANTPLTAFARSLLDDATAATARTTLGLGSVSNTSDADKPISNATQLALDAKQALNAKLTAISGLTWAANQLMYATGASTVAMAALTVFGRSVIAAADAPAVRTVIGLAGQSLQALNALTGVANGVPFFDSASTMQAAASTSYGRGLLALADAAAGRTAFALGTAATATLTTSTTDLTVGRVLKVGDHGVGGVTLPVVLGTEIDNLTTNGTFYATGGGGNQGSLPFNTNGYLINTVYATVYVMQTWTQVITNITWTRCSNNGVWGPWSKVFTQSTAVGTVSQTGGVPTGAIMERGTNTNGEFIKFADGTLLCWMAGTAYVDHTVANGNVTTQWTLPFPSTGTVTSLVTIALRSPNSTNTFNVNKLQSGMLTPQTAQFVTNFSVAQGYSFYYTFMGRWF